MKNSAYKHIENYIKKDWEASWIWAAENTSAENTWAVFRKAFTLDEAVCDLANAKAYIAVDSRYWLYINGKMAVREGGLKRGPTPTDGYYDEIDIGGYLKKGENTVAVLVWYWGAPKSYSYCTSGSAGFLFEAEIGNTRLISDSSWKAMLHPAFLVDNGEHQPNYRIAESNILYDARLDIGTFEKEAFDDSLWSCAYELGKAPCPPWNELYLRTIPQLKDFGLRDYKNSAEFENTVSDAERTIEVYPDYNMQMTPYIKLRADADKKIIIMTDNSKSQGAVISTYITRDGEQEFESLGWFNGDSVIYTVPAGVEVLSLKYRQSGYNSEFVGSFECDDEFMNTLWRKCLYTLYVTMRDNFMDCPDRERAQWWGDVTNEMAMSFYSLDNDAAALYQKGVLSLLAHTDAAGDNVLQTVVPIRNDYFELPLQQLAGICGFETYFLYTGDESFLANVYPYALRYLALWSIGEDGLVIHRSGSWDWPDWGFKADMKALENAWYFKACRAVCGFAKRLGCEQETAELSSKMSSIKKAYEGLWTEFGYKSEQADEPDDRANAMAILSGIAGSDKYKAVTKCLTSVYNSSPYMERYVLDALCELGEAQKAIDRIKLRYKEMVALPYTTLWEFWDKDAGTRNHAWTGGPMLTMSQYLAGIAPIEAGYKVWYVRPDFASLSHIDCKLECVKGRISLIADKAASGIKMTLTAPADTVAVLGAEYTDILGTQIFIDGLPVFENGSVCDNSINVTFRSSDKKYIYLNIPVTEEKNFDITINY